MTRSITWTRSPSAVAAVSAAICMVTLADPASAGWSGPAPARVARSFASSTPSGASGLTLDSAVARVIEVWAQSVASAARQLAGQHPLRSTDPPTAAVLAGMLQPADGKLAAAPRDRARSTPALIARLDHLDLPPPARLTV